MSYPNRPIRYPTHIPVVVSQNGEPQSGYIVYINAYGACLAGLENISADRNITLRGAIEANVATIRWNEDDRAGVFFDRPIPPQYLALLRLRGIAFQPVSQLSGIRAV